MVSAPWSTWNANTKSAWLICFVWLHPQPLEEAFSQKADEQVSAEQQPQLSCWRLNNEPVASADLLQQSCAKFLTSSMMLLCPGLAQKPWWTVASSVLVNPPRHESALTPGPNDVCWFMTALNVGSRDFAAKRNIWLVSDWSSECKHSHLQRGWRAEPCPRAKQGVNQPDSTETPREIYFHFGPSSSGSLSFVAIQALTHARTPIFHTSMLAQSQASWWQQCLSWGCHHVHPAPWIFHGHDVPAPAAPRTAGIHTTATLMLPNRRGTLPLQGWSVAFAADGSHSLTEPHLRKQHRGVQNKYCL